MSQSNHQLRVEHFMEKAGQELPKVPTLPSKEIRTLRARLIFEECMETINALGFNVAFSCDNKVYFIPDPYFESKSDIEHLTEIADGCADVKVVITGTLSALGIPDAYLQRMVDMNNLEKFGPGGKECPETGKWLKPADHQPPPIKEYLEELSNAEDTE